MPGYHSSETASVDRVVAWSERLGFPRRRWFAGAPEQVAEEMEITSGVHLVDGVRGSNVYLLTDGPMTLVDTGLPGNVAAILDFIALLGRDPGELAYIVLTHGHMDHSGSAAALKRVTGAKIVAHEDEGDVQDDGATLVTGDSNGRRHFLAGALARVARFEPCQVDVRTSDGELLSCAGGLRVVHTPGHTRGSMALLLEGRGVVFVGDAIIGNGDRLSRPLPFGSNAGESERSLAKLGRLSFETCCFGHGAPLTPGAAEAVRGLAGSPPRTPLWRRIIFRRHDLAGFGRRLRRR